MTREMYKWLSDESKRKTAEMTHGLDVMANVHKEHYEAVCEVTNKKDTKREVEE